MTERPHVAFLDDVLVVELGQRLGAGICGSLLAEAGATVVNIELPQSVAGVLGKQHAGTSLRPGKKTIMFDKVSGRQTSRAVADVLDSADVVIVSSDCDPNWLVSVTQAANVAAIVCDITAFGGGGPPFPTRQHADPLVQALAGAMDTSGEPDGPPALCECPIIEMSAALYAASGVIAALRVARRQHLPQNIEVALYDVAVGMLATFLPKNFAGGSAQRVGNHHPAMSPWNAFAAKDGWVLLCAGTNEQWARVCKLIGRPELAADPRFDSTTHRVANNAAVDAAIEPWIRTLTVAECVDKLNAISISTGPILRVEDLAGEPNLAHRGMVRTLPDGTTRVPGSPLRGSVARGVSPDSVPDPSADPVRCSELANSRPPRRGSARPMVQRRAPLAGVRVIEMGQFTTAPLVGRQLGALGADVIKLEPRGGEPAREMPPHRNGQGFFFTLSNSDTRVMTVDLRDPGRVELLEQLIAKADVLVENTKPGTLPRHGFTPQRILEINPRIVYCAISGFGFDAPSAGLGAMDTTIQGLAGIMDLTRVDGVPYKTGISIADLHAGQFALLATLAALEFRDRTGLGQVIDLAMLDAAAWVTRTCWNAEPNAPADFRVLACRDGHVLVRIGGDGPAATRWTARQAELEADAKTADRHSFVRLLEGKGFDAAPVQSVKEVLADPRTRERGLVFEAQARDGSTWNLLKCPIQLSRTPAEVRHVPGQLDADRDEILRDWGITWRPPQVET